MPQLDVAAFVTNFFWFVLVFFTLYVLVLKVFLPRLAKSFVFRSELVSKTLESAVVARLHLDYYGSSFQFLEATLAFSLMDSILICIRDSLEFQANMGLVDLSEFLEEEAVIEGLTSSKY